MLNPENLKISDFEALNLKTSDFEALKFLRIQILKPYNR